MLTKSNITLHQTLHGYENGHQLLASSITIPSRDARTLLVLSDISGPNASISIDGYLTGYPLTEIGCYALARTWLAPEMERPGCVWTHTLLIDFSDLATLKDLEILLKYHSRPEALNERTKYTKPLRLAESFRNDREPNIDFTRFRAILSAIYGHPNDRVFLTDASAKDIEQLILDVWEQQWPRLRRQFRFCTMSLSDRSTPTIPFDLQVIPRRERVQRLPGKNGSLILDSLSDFPSENRPWLYVAEQDLTHPNKSDFRDFLRIHGVSTSLGRGAFAPLATAYTYIHSKADASPSQIIKLLENEFSDPDEAATLKGLVIGVLIERTYELNKPSLLYLLKNIQLIDSETLKKHRNKITKAIWVHCRDQIWPLLSGSPKEQLLGEGISGWLTCSSALDATRADSDKLARLASIAPSITEDPEFWKSGENAKATLQHLKISDAQLVISAMISSDVLGLASAGVRKFGHSLVLTALTARLDSFPEERHSTSIAEWALAVTTDHDILRNHLLSGLVKHVATILVLMTAITPQSMPSKEEPDPWLKSVQYAKGSVEVTEFARLHAFLFVRGLSDASTNAAGLLAYSFSTIHDATERRELDWRTSTQIEDAIPTFGFWIDWDKARRIRLAVGQKFAQQRLPPDVFLSLAKHGETFRKLVNDTASIKVGKRYLRTVNKYLKEHPNSAPDSWIKIISNAL